MLWITYYITIPCGGFCSSSSICMIFSSMCRKASWDSIVSLCSSRVNSSINASNFVSTEAWSMFCSWSHQLKPVERCFSLSGVTKTCSRVFRINFRVTILELLDSLAIKPSVSRTVFSWIVPCFQQILWWLALRQILDTPLWRYWTEALRNRLATKQKHQEMWSVWGHYIARRYRKSNNRCVFLKMSYHPIITRNKKPKGINRRSESTKILRLLKTMFSL